MNTDLQSKIENNGDNEEMLEQHVINLWQPFTFKATKDYDYLRRGVLKRASNFIMRLIVFLTLNIYNRLVFGLRIEGGNNLKEVKDKGYILISNHVHTNDCTFIDCLLPFKRIYYATLETNFQIPIVRHLIRVLNAVPIPSSVHIMKIFLDNMAKAISYKNVICMYPECYLIPYYKGVRKFKKGAFKMAVNNNCPIVPMVVTFREQKVLYRYLKRKPCITVSILEPVYPKPDESDNNNKASIELMEKCHSMMKQAADLKYIK